MEDMRTVAQMGEILKRHAKEITLPCGHYAKDLVVHEQGSRIGEGEWQVTSTSWFVECPTCGNTYTIRIGN